MFNAAKAEALKSLEKPFKKMIERLYVNMQQYLDTCKTKVVASNEKKILTLTQQVKILEHQILSLKEQMEQEESYFNDSIDLLEFSSHEERRDNHNQSQTQLSKEKSIYKTNSVRKK